MLTVIGDTLFEPVIPPGLLVAVHEVMEEPWLLPGVNATEAVSVFTAPAVAVPMVGASGAADGVIALDEPEDRPLPLVFVQYTVNVYDVPIVKALTVMGLEPALVPV